MLVVVVEEEKMMLVSRLCRLERFAKRRFWKDKSREMVLVVGRSGVL